MRHLYDDAKLATLDQLKPQLYDNDQAEEMLLWFHSMGYPGYSDLSVGLREISTGTKAWELQYVGHHKWQLLITDDLLDTLWKLRYA